MAVLKVEVHPMEWLVQLVGDEADLKMLEQSFQVGPLRITTNERGDFLLGSDDFRESDEPKAIREKASRLLSLVSASTRLLLDSSESIRPGVVMRSRPDGNYDQFLFAEPAQTQWRIGKPTVTMTHADGTQMVFRPADPVRDWVTVAREDENVAKVLNQVAAGVLDWVRLYRVFEIMRDDLGGEKTFLRSGWCSKSRLNDFTMSANHPKVAGPDARHGVMKTEPPKKPMSLPEARAFIISIVHSWMTSKLQGSS